MKDMALILQKEKEKRKNYHASFHKIQKEN